jgi:predicted ester cyclase
MKTFSITLFAIVFVVLIACRDKKTIKNNDTLTTINYNKNTLKKTTKNYMNAWSDYDTLLLQSITIQKFVRNVNGDNISFTQHELFNSIHFWYRVMPDLKIVDKEIIVVENRTYVNWVGTGTNTGMFGDIPPTGKVGHINGFSILTFNDDSKIVHEIAFFDKLSLMEAWGYSLAPPVMN